MTDKIPESVKSIELTREVFERWWRGSGHGLYSTSDSWDYLVKEALKPKKIEAWAVIFESGRIEYHDTYPTIPIMSQYKSPMLIIDKIVHLVEAEEK